MNVLKPSIVSSSEHRVLRSHCFGDCRFLSNKVMEYIAELSQGPENALRDRLS